MISPGYIARQFRAVLAMAQNHPLWREWLDADANGFYRSFWAVPIATPLIVASMVMATRFGQSLPELQETFGDLPPMGFMIILKVIVTPLIWAGNVGVLIILSRRVDGGRSVSPLVTGFNWSEVMIQLLIFVVLLVVSVISAAPVFLALLLGIYIFAVYLRWGILRRALARGGLTTAAIIGLLYLVQLLINTLVSGIGVSLFDAVTGK